MGDDGIKLPPKEGRLQEAKPGTFMEGPTRGPGSPRGPLGPAAPMPISPCRTENPRGLIRSKDTA